MMKIIVLAILSTAPLVDSFTFQCNGIRISRRYPTNLMMKSSRVDFLRDCVVTGATFISATFSVGAEEEFTTSSGLKVKKINDGTGQKCEIGDLAAVRFKGRYKDYEFDNLFESAEPLYIRVGGGNIIKGIDEAILMMKIGDRWELTIPGPLGFGDKGRPASAGKPRIPPNATLTYEVELVSLPGKEGELFDSLESE